MSINRLFLRIALLLFSISSICLAGIGNSKTKLYPANYFHGNQLQGLTTAKVFSTDKVVAVKFTSPFDASQLYVYAGTFSGDVNGNGAKFYCIDIGHELAYFTADQPHIYTDSGNTSSKITYILNKYYPLNPFPYSGSLSAEEREAASVQIAIWHFSDSVDVSTLLDNPDIMTRANQIIDDANLNAGNTAPIETLVITPLNQTLQTGTTGGFYVTAFDHNNNPLPNVQVTLTSSSGTLSSVTTVTGIDGKTPIISLIPGTDTTAVIKAIANVTIPQGTRYVHSIQPDNFQKLVLATPATSLKEASVNISWMNLHLASIGDRVWFDTNRNGIQDSNETGASSVSVHLYDCNGNILLTTLTDNNGLYHFDSLAAGNYYVKFDLLSANYRFSPSKIGNDGNIDSDADSTGRTECFALAVNEHQYKWDAGIYIPESPVVFLTKDDDRVFMADSGSTVTYTIKFANTGHVQLHNVTIVDSLPSGLSYVSCTGAVSCGETANSSVTFQIGTVDTSATGQVTLTALVSGKRSEYLNSAYLVGTDIYGRSYSAYASDLDLCDTTSSGGGAGAESKANMSELLLKRLLKIENGQTTRILPKTKYGNITSTTTLQNLIPQVGPFNSTAIETTPFDILGISNAVSAYAADYMASTEIGLRRVAGIFSTITPAPYIYDHLKSVCDRLAGAQVTSLDLVSINNNQFYASKISRPGITDYTISFCLYETASGFSVENKWTYDEYVAPNNTLAVYNFQVWSSSISATISMVKNILSAASIVKPLTYMNKAQLKPSVYIKSAFYTHDGKIHLIVVNNNSSSQVSLKTLYRVAQGGDQSETLQNITVNTGESSVILNSSVVSDAQVYLTAQGFMDEIFVSGGAYTFMNGTTSSVSTFNTTDYPQADPSQFPSGSLILAGGVSVSGNLNDWISVVRSLNANASAYDLSGYNGITFKASGINKVQVFIDMDGIQNFNYFTKTIALTPTQQSFTLKFSDFSQRFGSQLPLDVSKIKYIGFILDETLNPGVTAFNFEVRDIAIVTSLTGINTNEIIPVKFSLDQNFPNPFNPSTIIRYGLPNSEKVTVKIYDIIGREVRTLVNEEKSAGTYSAFWNGRNNEGTTVTSGVYLYRIHAGNYIETRKMTLVK